jgi:hypothetical protein
MGEGTTKAIADAMLGDEMVYSIEVNPRYYEIARKKHKNTSINFLLGLSVSRPLLPTDFTWDVPPNIVIDHLDHNREILYKQEVSFNVPDNMLDFALSKMDYKPDLVILDSAGHMGLVEFKELMKLAQAPFFLALDDTNHIKHYQSVELLKAMDVDLVFETEEGFGSRIYYIK